jgi:hypothetical protein
MHDASRLTLMLTREEENKSVQEKNTEGEEQKDKSIMCQIEITGYEKRPILFAFF